MKRISPGTITLAVCAILFGLVAAYAAKQYLAPKAKEDKGVPVLVAKFNLPRNSRIQEQYLEIVKKPADQVPPGALNGSARVLQRVNKEAILSGQPIVEEMLFPVGYAPSLAEQIPPGMRAVTFAVDPNNALGGVVSLQSVVDIALTVKGEQPELHGITTKTILHAIKVLATSEGLFKAEDHPNPSIKNVTVAVTPEQANKLILAQRYGTLSVTLCSATDAEFVSDVPNRGDEVNPLTLLGLKPIEPKKPEAVVKTQVWRGSQMTELTFKDDRVQEEKTVTVASHVEEPASPVVPASYGRGDATPRETVTKKAVVTRGRGE